MKKKYLLIVAFIAFLGVAVSGCVIDRGYYHPYHTHLHYWQHY